MSQPDTLDIPLQLAGHQIERMVVVGGDLEFLRELPADRLPSHTEVRLIAGVLRRLFVDHGSGEVGRLMQAIPLSPKPALAVECSSLDELLNDWNPDWVRSAWAGGAETGGAQHAGQVMAIIPKAAHEAYEDANAFIADNPIRPRRRRLAIADWLRSTALAVRTEHQGLVRISRATVMKYVANRKGGVHFDPTRKLDADDPKKRRLEQHFHLLDHGLLRVGHLSGPEYEVVAMAQDVAKSDWAAEFIRVGEAVAPTEFGGDPTEMKVWTGLKEADGTGWATFTYAASEESERPSSSRSFEDG